SRGGDRSRRCHIADGSRQEWGWVPCCAQQMPEALQTGYAFSKKRRCRARRRLTRALKTLLEPTVSEGRFQLQVVEAVDRLDLDAAHRAVLQHLERDADAGVPLRPDLAVEIGQILLRLALYPDDHLAALDARPVPPPP